METFTAEISRKSSATIFKTCYSRDEIGEKSQPYNMFSMINGEQVDDEDFAQRHRLVLNYKKLPTHNFAELKLFLSVRPWFRVLLPLCSEIV
ncbi:hypothetical protein PoB_002047600 [Plakobranchus ocellatus]|uniref:Uncharacterized protein n=1 Tax=Plakobranchus ocellatus TaxID=259542 RepID=A0AAV3ZH55_9GAST|nr:hypothetical protein PoB_002047600 [Plakobranchus ocellatus]